MRGKLKVTQIARIASDENKIIKKGMRLTLCALHHYFCLIFNICLISSSQTNPYK